MNWTINIDKRPYSFTEYYGGRIYSNKGVYKFALIISDTFEEITWIDNRPKSHKQIELNIIKHFKKR